MLPQTPEGFLKAGHARITRCGDQHTNGVRHTVDRCFFFGGLVFFRYDNFFFGGSKQFFRYHNFFFWGGNEIFFRYIFFFLAVGGNEILY